MKPKRTQTQEKARRADRKSLERAMLLVLRRAYMPDPGRLHDSTQAKLYGLEQARREL